LGAKHAERVDVALRTVLSRDADRDLERFFAEDVPEPFFVKNLERVQGDERDAIIISVGYGKHPDGRMRYQWGPLLRDGGERRLNVAATRARRRLTVVSSFSSHDVDPSRLTAPGARMLAEYLEYARAGGVHVAAAGYPQGTAQSPGDSAAGYRPDGRGDAGAFHTDVAARLAELGITVVPQYGVGGYRVDFAAAHPDDPTRMILAIEADGAGYRDSGSVRDRDRLRKEHLERLGWRVHRLWSTAWFTDSAGELAKLRAAFDSAVGAAPPPPPPEPAAEPTLPPEPVAEPTAPSGPEGQAGPDGHAGPDGEPGPRVQSAPDGQGPWPEPPPEAGEGRRPLAAPRAEAIPLGPGQRARLSAPARRALPAPPEVGAAALSPGSEPDSR
jgi:very-short-patch-repair endonuclease